MSGMTRREWMAAGTAGITSLALARPNQSREEASIHYDHILGTSLDAWLNVATKTDSDKAESAILAEVERLRLVFSLYDSESELSRWNRANGPVHVSVDLGFVLTQYQQFYESTRGACSPTVASASELWKQAERIGVLPNANQLAADRKSVV